MIDKSFLRRLGWTDDLIEAAQRVAEETAQAEMSGPEIRILESAEVSIETTDRIDLTMAPELSVWPRLSRP
jgi:hypothetical protein